MQLDDILATIRCEADDELRELGDVLALEVAAISADAEEQGVETERVAVSSLDAAADREVARIVNRAHLEATRKKMAAIEAGYQEALEALRVRIGALRATSSYTDLLARLLDEGLRILPDATRVHVDRADIGPITAALVAIQRDEFVVEAPLTCLGGLTLVTDDGRAVRNTFDSRLDRADRRLRRLVAEHLPEREAT